MRTSLFRHHDFDIYLNFLKIIQKGKQALGVIPFIKSLSVTINR